MIKTNSFSFNQFKSNVQPVSKGKNHKKEKTQKDKELSTNYIQRNRATEIATDCYEQTKARYGFSGSSAGREKPKSVGDEKD